MRETCEVKLRNFVIDALVARSGKCLSPDIIREISEDIVTRGKDLMEYYDRVEEE